MNAADETGGIANDDDISRVTGHRLPVAHRPSFGPRGYIGRWVPIPTSRVSSFMFRSAISGLSPEMSITSW